MGEKLSGKKKEKRRRVVFRPCCSPPLLLLSLTAASTWNSTERARSVRTHSVRHAHTQAGNSLSRVLCSEGSVGLAVKEKWRANLHCFRA